MATKPLNKLRLDFLVQDKTSGILKAPTNRLSYKDVRLKNGLRCILISDPKSDEDAKSSPSSPSPSSSSSSNDDDESEKMENEVNEEDSESKPGSEKDGDEAAAAMCVNVGSLEDPAEVQGLAHLMEHVITMGSKKYPEENEMDTFLGNVAGQSNASTTVMETMFDFEVSCKFFEC